MSDALPPASSSDPRLGPKAELAKVIPRRPRVSWWLGLVLALGFAVLVMPSITADRWFPAKIQRGEAAAVTVRVPPFAGYQTSTGVTRGGGILIARGEIADRDTAVAAAEIDRAMPHGGGTYLAYLLLLFVLGALFTHHVRRSTMGRLLRVQLASLGVIAAVAIVVKAVMLTTGLSVLVVPVALFAMVPTLVLDRIVGLATGTLAALVVSFLVPFDVGVAIMLLVQAGAAGLVVAERPKKRLRAAIVGGAAATLATAATYPLMIYLTAGVLPMHELRDPLHSAWLAAALGPALATSLAIVLAPLYQLLVGEITQARLVELEDLSHPLLKQIANKAPGTWQHSLTMANMAEIAANAIGANGRLVRVGAYYHDLGKSLQPKYFIENLEPGETSPHDKLPPEVSCDAIFAHVTEGIVTARKAGLHERIVDFMHMHHGNGVLEYFWAKCREQGNPRGLSVEDFRYPGVPPHSRETAILSICDAVEAAARTLKKPEVSAIDNLVQRIVYGKLHLGQLDESGLSMADLRLVADSLRETIRHANHGRIEYPWQKAQQDASASANHDKLTQTGPRLDSLDRPARPDMVASPPPTSSSHDALAATDSIGATPNLRQPPRDSSEAATRTTAPVLRAHARGETAPPVRQSISTELEARLGGPLPTDNDETRPAPKIDVDEIHDSTRRAERVDPANDYEEAVLELRDSKPVLGRDSQPVLGRDSQPVLGRDSQPVLGRDSQPVLGRDSQPALGETLMLDRHGKPILDRDGQPAFDPLSTLPAMPTAADIEASRPSHASLGKSAATTQPSAPRLSDLAASRMLDEAEPAIVSPLGPRAPSSPEESARMSRVTEPTVESVRTSRITAEDGARMNRITAEDSARMNRITAEDSARMNRITAPVDGDRDAAAEAMQFAAEAKHALDAAARDLAIARESGEPGTARLAAEEPAPAARKRAATLPPIPPPTVPPPLGRRSPTLPPLPAQLFGASPTTTVPPSDTLRPPARPTPSAAEARLSAQPLPHATVPPPDALRAPGPNLLDDMVTLRPSYEKRPALDISEGDDGSVLIQPTPMVTSDDASSTHPRMAPANDASIGDVTSPNIEIPERAPKTSWAQSLADRIDRQLDDDDDGDGTFDPNATHQQSDEEIERLHRADTFRPVGTRQPSIAESERLHRADAFAPEATRQQSIDEIERLHRADAFAPEATRQQSIGEIERLHREGLLDRPADATRQLSAEQVERLHREGLLDRPEDATRQLSTDQIERLHREGAIDGPSDPELTFTRRGPFPTTEVDDSDIESAIELAPPARRSSIGVAKKKPPE